MSITDSIANKPHINITNSVLNIQRLALQMASFGAKKRIDVWVEEVDEFTLDYLSVYFQTSIRPKDEINPSYLLIRSEHSDIYVKLKED